MLPSEMKVLMTMDVPEIDHPEHKEEETKNFEQAVPRMSVKEDSTIEEPRTLSKSHSKQYESNPKSISTKGLRRSNISSRKGSVKKEISTRSIVSRPSKNFSSRRSNKLSISKGSNAARNSKKLIENNFSSQKLSVELDSQLKESDNLEELHIPQQKDTMVNISRQIEELRLSDSFKRSQNETPSIKSTPEEISSKVSQKSTSDKIIKMNSNKAMSVKSRTSKTSKHSRKSSSNYSAKKSKNFKKSSHRQIEIILNEDPPKDEKKQSGFWKTKKSSHKKESTNIGYPTDSKGIEDVIGKDFPKLEYKSNPKSKENLEEVKTEHVEILTTEKESHREQVQNSFHDIVEQVKEAVQVHQPTPEHIKENDSKVSLDKEKSEEHNKPDPVNNLKFKEKQGLKGSTKKKIKRARSKIQSQLKRDRSQRLKKLNQIKRQEKSQNLNKKYKKLNPHLPLNSYKRNLEKKGKAIPTEINRSLTPRKKRQRRRKTANISASKTNFRSDILQEKDIFYEKIFNPNSAGDLDQKESQKTQIINLELSEKVKNTVNRLYKVKNNSKVAQDKMPLKSSRRETSSVKPFNSTSRGGKNVYANSRSPLNKKGKLWKDPKIVKDSRSTVKDFIHSKKGMSTYWDKKNNVMDQRLRNLEIEKKKIIQLKFEMNQLKFLIEREDKMKMIRNAGTDSKDMEDRWVLRQKLKGAVKEMKKAENQFLKQMKEENWEDLRKFKKENHENNLKEVQDKINYVSLLYLNNN